MYSLVGLLILILDIWAVVKVINSSEDTATKVLWVLIILILPVLGLIAWLVIGPGRPT